MLNLTWVKFDTELGEYIGKIFIKEELECLQEFIFEARRGLQIEKRKFIDLGDGYYMVIICHHVLEMNVRKNGRAIVRKMYPAQNLY